jgi:excisionase family DNA binding protein
VYFPGGGESMNTKSEGGSSDTGIMNVHDVARYLRLSEAQVYKLASQNSIPAIRIGKSWRFRKEFLDEWMRKGTVGVVQFEK